jgi:hypothetical protein
VASTSSSNGRAADSTMRPPPTPAAAPHGLHQSACNPTDVVFKMTWVAWQAGAQGPVWGAVRDRAPGASPGWQFPGAAPPSRPHLPAALTHACIHFMYFITWVASSVGRGLHCARNGRGGESGSSVGAVFYGVHTTSPSPAGAADAATTEPAPAAPGLSPGRTPAPAEWRPLRALDA